MENEPVGGLPIALIPIQHHIPFLVAHLGNVSNLTEICYPLVMDHLSTRSIREAT